MDTKNKDNQKFAALGDYNPEAEAQLLQTNAAGDYSPEAEAQITLLMAKTFHFTDIGKFWRCNLCGARMMKNYIGLYPNERMIAHYELNHLRDTEYRMRVIGAGNVIKD